MSCSVTREVELVLRAFRAVLGNSRGTYVAIPMTSGRRYLDWAESTGVRQREGDDTWARIFEEVVKPNIEAARPFVERLRKEWPLPILDPTELEVLEGWQQIDFYTLWEKVFDQFIRSLILFEGWEYSVGCCKEVARALELELPVVNMELRELGSGEIERRISEAISEMTERGFPTESLRECLERIEALGSSGRE